MKRILKFDGEWENGNAEIARDAVSFFNDQFIGGDVDQDMTLLDHINSKIRRC